MKLPKIKLIFKDNTEKVCWLLEMTPVGVSVQDRKDFSFFNVPKFYAIDEISEVVFFKKPIKKKNVG